MTDLIRPLLHLNMDPNERDFSGTRMPFGYEFGNLQRPHDAPGQPLLTETGTHSLEGFWDNPNSVSQFLNFDLIDTTTPPEFLGQINPQNDHSPYHSSNFSTFLEAGYQASADFDNDHSQVFPTEDVLGAATALFGNVHNVQQHGLGFSSASGYGRQASFNCNGHYRQEARRTPVAASAQYPTGFQMPPRTSWRENGFSIAQRHPPTTALNSTLLPYNAYLDSSPRPNSSHGLKFGSDNSFAHAGFIRGPHESEEAASAAMLSSLQAFQPQSTAPSTQPASPGAQRGRRTSETHTVKGEEDHEQDDPEQPVPRKRRKLKCKTEDGGDYTPSNSRPKHARRTASTAINRQSHVRTESSVSFDASTLPTSNGSPVLPTSAQRVNLSSINNPADSRRRSVSNAQSSGAPPRHKASKLARENLTEQQKKENHIRSEKKRRDLITQGFKDLESLVPALKGGGISKSNMLAEAATYLEGIVAGNKRLKQLLGENDSGGVHLANGRDGNGVRDDG